MTCTITVDEIHSLILYIFLPPLGKNNRDESELSVQKKNSISRNKSFSFQSLKIPFLGFVIAPVMCIYDFFLYSNWKSYIMSLYYDKFYKPKRPEMKTPEKYQETRAKARDGRSRWNILKKLFLTPLGMKQEKYEKNRRMKRKMSLQTECVHESNDDVHETELDENITVGIKEEINDYNIISKKFNNGKPVQRQEILGYYYSGSSNYNLPKQNIRTRRSNSLHPGHFHFH